MSKEPLGDKRLSGISPIEIHEYYIGRGMIDDFVEGLKKQGAHIIRVTMNTVVFSWDERAKDSSHVS